eukprot:6465274-Amphidinium_carterae.1
MVYAQATASPAATDEMEQRELFGSDVEDVVPDDMRKGNVCYQTDDSSEIAVTSPDLGDYWSFCEGTDQIPGHDPKTYFQHVLAGHYPKMSTCPVCQMADGPPYVHRKLERAEVGKLSIDLVGPLSSDGQGIFIALKDTAGMVHETVMADMKPNKRKKVKAQRELVLPFCRLLSSHDSVEVGENLRVMIEEIEAYVTPLMPSHVPSNPRVLHVHLRVPSPEIDKFEEHMVDVEALVEPFLPAEESKCVLRVHSDRAGEFLTEAVCRVLSDKGVFHTVTSAKSPSSNGRAESAIRVLKSVIRRLLVASKLPVWLWSFASRHACQVLRASALKKAGQVDVSIPQPFSTYVSVRRLGHAKSFAPFESRGEVGRILLDNATTDRLAYILCDDGVIRRGTSPALTFPGTMMGDDRVSLANAEQHGWKKVALQIGMIAWLNGEHLLLTPPRYTEVSDSVHDVSVEEPEEDLTDSVVDSLTEELNRVSDLEVSDINACFPD